jgi:hypothetical protein
MIALESHYENKKFATATILLSGHVTLTAESLWSDGVQLCVS